MFGRSIYHLLLYHKTTILKENIGNLTSRPHNGLGPGNFENWPPSNFVFASMNLEIERKFIAEKIKIKSKA